jgi:hypothetical protein
VYAKWIKNKKYRSIAGQGFVFGGVYSNSKLWKSNSGCPKEGISQNCISTGDIIGYCAQPEETIQFFKMESPALRVMLKSS